MELRPDLPERPCGPGAFGPGMVIKGTHHPVADRPIQLNRFAGRRDPTPEEKLTFEKPWHRAAAYHWASGKMSLMKIAEACEVSYQQVQKLAKNPWFQETVNLILKENGAQDIMDLFKAECQNSLLTVIELRDDVKAPASVRRQAAIDILHQCLGKPTQRVEAEDVTPRSADPVGDAAAIEREAAENARLRESLGIHPDAVQSEPSQRAVPDSNL